MKHIVLILVFLFTLNSFSQNEVNNWAVTLGSGSVLYSVENGPDMGGRLIPQFPRLSVAAYVFKNITLAGSISSDFNDNQKYTTYDGEVRYDFGTSENTINPYILIGGSLIKSKHVLPTLNFGIGGTLWISDHFGLQGVIMHKYNEERFQSQRSHTYGAVGVTYRFSLSGGNGRSTSGRKRIWESKH
ncbi:MULTISPECIES: hypothetical protein [Polaribacter]|uniref:Outer membrane protein beta-barrel domain-containing protein n=1 Tax=Polaribacter sejongensis TaxID=985043 RepID=A0AAJ1QUK2_9FLAO|nr:MULTISPECIES: hypothetical protein [Polaribacter]MDN3618548.1 hypothetical protein [Polaribacter undariae]UWD30471.1 hypothetical protein NQP51_09995 [Polaribacter undariae]